MRRLSTRRIADNRDRQTRVRPAIAPGPRPPRLTKSQLARDKKAAKIYDWYGLRRPPHLVKYPRVYRGEGAIDYKDLGRLKSEVEVLTEIVTRVSAPDDVNENTYLYFYPIVQRRQHFVQYLHDLFLPIENFPMNRELHELKARYLGVFDVVDEKLRELEVKVLRRVYLQARNDDFLGSMFTWEVNMERGKLETIRKKADKLLSYTDPDDIGLGGYVPRPATDELFFTNLIDR